MANRTRLSFATRNEWLQARDKGIGASEVGTIIGVNPYQTPYQLWLRKTGREKPEPENEAMLMGHLLEDAVAQRWAIETRKDIIKSTQEDFMFIDPKKPHLRVSPDRLYWLDETSRSDDNKGILECKTTMRDITEDDVPMSWYCQVQMNLGIANYQHGSLAWLKMGREFGYKNFEFDKDFFKWMVEMVDKFWIDNIQGGKEPDPVNVQDILLKYPKEDVGKALEANESLVSDIGRLKEIKEQIKELEAAKNDIENQLKIQMCDAESIMYQGSKLATWKAPKPSQKFDVTAFKLENGELYAKYLTEVQGARRFLVK